MFDRTTAPAQHSAPTRDGRLVTADPVCGAGTASAVYIFDATVPDLATLKGGVPAGAGVFDLPAGEDGVRALAAHLAGLTNIEELHIVSHGRDGALALGNTVLSQETLDAYAV